MAGSPAGRNGVAATSSDRGVAVGYRSFGRSHIEVADLVRGRAWIDKIKRPFYQARFAVSGGARRGGVAEWLKAADCKSADVRLRRFESYPLHQPVGMGMGETGRWSRDRLRSYLEAGVAQW